MSSTLTTVPVCGMCGDKFPGDPCKTCGHSAVFSAPELDVMFAEADRRERDRVAIKLAARHLRRPTVTRRRRRKHGRQ